jgi:hypothetical protein
VHFLSPDPLGHAACMYLYSYASGDPVNSVDPDGRFGKSAASQVWGGIKSTAQFGVSLLGAYAWEATSYLGEDAAKPFEQSFVAANSVVPNAVQNYQDNLAIQGSHAGAINATFNPFSAPRDDTARASCGMGRKANSAGALHIHFLRLAAIARARLRNSSNIRSFSAIGRVDNCAR